MRRTAAILGTGLALTAGVSGCGSPSTATTRASTPSPAPLDFSLATSVATFAVVAMGDLHQANSTFWQLLARPAGTSRWSLRTPEGAATNGGLALAARGPRTLVAILPSGRLEYSPLALSSDGGSSYRPGVADFAVEAGTDSVAVGPGKAAAVTPEGLWTAPSASRGPWSKTLELRSLDHEPSARACDPVRLDAVSGSPYGELLGVTCGRRGQVGVFRSTPSGWVRDAPRFVGASHEDLEVIALAPSGAGVTLVVAGRSRAHGAYGAAWLGTGDRWATTPMVDSNGPLRSVAVSATGNVALLSGPPGRASARVVGAAGGEWGRSTTVPTDTGVVLAAPSGDEALVVDRSVVSVELLSGTHWVRVQRLRVPIAYGSSS